MRNILLRWFIYPNIYIAIIAMMMSWETQYLYGIRDHIFLWFIFFSTLLSYGFHSLVNTVYKDISPRHDWNLKNRVLLYIITGVSAVAALIIFISHYRNNLFPFLAGAALTFAYSVPNIEGRFFGFLRKIAFGKTFFLAMMWTYATTILPVLAIQPDAEAISAFTGSRFYLVYAICILFDMRDRDDDRMKGIRALPTMLNEKAVMVYYWFSLLIAVFFSIMYTWPGITITTWILLLPIAFMFIVPRFQHAVDNEIMYYILLDGLMMLSAILHAIYLFSSTFVAV